MTTYLLITSNKPTELTAFLGPKEPPIAIRFPDEGTRRKYERECSDYQKAIETAKALRLPVVNPVNVKDAIGFWFPEKRYLENVGTLQLDTPVELEGWEPEKVTQILGDNGWSDYQPGIPLLMHRIHRQAYRLKRSESVNKVPEGVELFASAHERMEEMQRCNHEYHGPCVDGFVRCHWCGTPKESPIETKTQEAFDTLKEAQAYSESISFIARTTSQNLEAMLLSFTHQVIVHQENRHKAQLESPNTQESQEDLFHELFGRLYDTLERGNGTMENIKKEFILTRRNP